MRPAFAHCSAAFSPLLHLRRRAFSALTSPFREGDIVLVKQTDRPDAPPILSRPLQQDGLIESHRGAIAHRDIIGKSPSQIVTASTGRPHHLHHPTLADYVRLTPRLVTPVYAGEANLIVSLLDIHASAQDARDIEEGVGPLEILEVGTGHGSLTLHLARAIHAANASVTDSEPGVSVPPMARGAIVHTLDVSASNSKHAKRIVHNFRRGLYDADVKFHVGTISDFVAAQTQQRESSSPFLSYALLDIPGVDEQFEHVCSILHPQGLLAAFSPSVTQLVDGIKVAKRKRLPLFLDRVVELGAGMGAGRLWDLRLVAPKYRRNDAEILLSQPADNETGDTHDEESTSRDSLPSLRSEPDRDIDDWNVICRPKYGDVSTAGGFLGIWRKIRHD